MRKVKLSDLTLWDKNPRTIKDKRFKALCKSITDDPSFMELRPILATKEGRIYAGNMRYRAVKELGWKEVPDLREFTGTERVGAGYPEIGEGDGELSSTS